MSYEDLLAVAKTRRSVRSYKPDAVVPMEKVMEILEVARWTPSGANTQPWEFILVRDKGKLSDVAKVFKDQELRYNLIAPHFPHPPQDYHKDVSTYVAVCSDDRFKAVYPRGEPSASAIFLLSIGACIQNIVLAATSLGIACAFVTPAFEEQAHKELKEIFGLPKYMTVHALVPFGSAATANQVTPRRPLENMVHHDQFDQTRLRGDEMTDPATYFQSLVRSFQSGKSRR